MKHAILCLTILCSMTASAITRSELAEYAQSLKGLKKAELKTQVHKLIGSPDVLEYGSGYKKTWWGFYLTDRIESTNECVNRYSNSKFTFTSQGSSITGMNIEHSFPSSWWGGTKNKTYKDLYNLYPSDSKANNSKQNYPMGIVENVKEESEGYDKVGTGTIDGVKGRNCWEPGNQYKGDFARAYMYMATAYQNLTWSGTQGKQQLETGDWPTLKPWAYTLYLKWLKSDPVDELEVNRNDAVAAIQQNRNLFVDYPYLAEYIWGDSINVAFDPYTSITTAVDDARYIGHATTIDIATPVFSPNGGTFTTPQEVTITCATDDVFIYYTTDGSSPITNGKQYIAPIPVDESMMLRAVASDGEDRTSSIATAFFNFVTVGDTIFAETFDKCKGTGGNDGQFSGNVASSASDYDNEGWVADAKYGGDGCARFGKSSGTGTGIVTTPNFNINGTSTLTFKAAQFATDGTSLKLSVNGNGKLSETEFTMVSGKWTEYTLTLTGQGEVSITFTPAKRFFLDEVYVIAEKEDEPLPGDVDGDGIITTADAIDLINIVLGKADEDDYETETADFDQNGVLDIIDITKLIELLMKQKQ